jgi:hypothetical protein
MNTDGHGLTRRGLRPQPKFQIADFGFQIFNSMKLTWRPTRSNKKLIKTNVAQEDAMERFIQRFGEKIIGVLNGFDRLVFRGTLRSIAYPFGMKGFLWHKQVKLKDFGSYVQKVTHAVKEASCRAAEENRRPVQYLGQSRIDKAEMAEMIRQKDQIEKGLIAIISSVEPCMAYDVTSRQGLIDLVLRERKCLNLYHYLIDPRFGFMNARIQSWFPFNIQICINGREWLSQQMDRIGLKYLRRENCFLWIEDLEQAQRLMSQHLKLNWVKTLDEIAVKLNPIHEKIFSGFPVKYYWSTFESEWATDLMFNDRQELERIYPSLILHGITTYQSKDVMKFLGKRYPSNTDREIGAVSRADVSKESASNIGREKIQSSSMIRPLC